MAVLAPNINLIIWVHDWTLEQAESAGTNEYFIKKNTLSFILPLGAEYQEEAGSHTLFARVQKILYNADTNEIDISLKIRRSKIDEAISVLKEKWAQGSPSD